MCILARILCCHNLSGSPTPASSPAHVPGQMLSVVVAQSIESIEVWLCLTALEREVLASVSYECQTQAGRVL